MLGNKFGAGFAHRVKAARHKTASTGHLNEIFVTLRGDGRSGIQHAFVLGMNGIIASSHDSKS
ncbi:hypothetical protein P0D84_48235 [Paraburkholderia sp. RL17-337-BIB-A]